MALKTFLGKKKAIFMIIFVIIFIISVSVFYLFYVHEEPLFEGYMLANDSGEPKGGFEWAGTYNVSVTDKKLRIVFTLGLSDPLDQHTYDVKLVEYVENEHIILKIRSATSGDWVSVTFSYCENDTLWNKYHGYYIAHYISASIFKGFSSHYYVEIGLKPI